LSLYTLRELLRPESVRGGEEHRSGGEHDGRVVGAVGVIEGDEVVDDEVHEGRVLLGEHKVVRNADRNRGGKNDGEIKERVHVATAADVEIHVDTAKAVKDEVANDVGALDGVLVAVEGVEEPGVVVLDELAGSGIRPQLELAARRKRISTAV
jgi:hypothetical protein